MQRNQAGSNWISKAGVFSLSTCLAGIVSGGLLGVAGSFVAFNIRIAIAIFLALMAIAVAVAELSGYRIGQVQCNRETPQIWVHHGPMRWAVQNGLALGCGAFNRIGFWLWYVIPASAFLAGSPLLGAAIYGMYGFMRGMAIWPIILWLGPRRGGEVGDWLTGRKEVARIITVGQLLVLGVVVTVVMGL